MRPRRRPRGPAAGAAARAGPGRARAAGRRCVVEGDVGDVGLEGRPLHRLLRPVSRGRSRARRGAGSRRRAARLRRSPTPPRCGRRAASGSSGRGSGAARPTERAATRAGRSAGTAVGPRALTATAPGTARRADRRRTTTAIAPSARKTPKGRRILPSPPRASISADADDAARQRGGEDASRATPIGPSSAPIMPSIFTSPSPMPSCPAIFS